jgi:hypothetical protein
MGAVFSSLAAFSVINLTMLSSFFFGEGLVFTIGQAAQRAPQKTSDPALAGSARTRYPRTHSWCDRHTPAL